MNHQSSFGHRQWYASIATLYTFLNIKEINFFLSSEFQPYNDENQTPKMISRTITVCGFLNLADIGSPMSVSRHLILPNENVITARPQGTTDAEKLDNDIKSFYSKTEEEGTTDHNKSTDESACVLLHGALKFENLAAVVLLNDDCFGFVHSYSDSKRKSNIILTILPPGKCLTHCLLR